MVADNEESSSLKFGDRSKISWNCYKVSATKSENSSVVLLDLGQQTENSVMLVTVKERYNVFGK